MPRSILLSTLYEDRADDHQTLDGSLQVGETPTIFSMLLMIPRIRAPTMVPHTVPRPPSIACRR